MDWLDYPQPLMINITLLASNDIGSWLLSSELVSNSFIDISVVC